MDVVQPVTFTVKDRPRYVVFIKEGIVIFYKNLRSIVKTEDKNNMTEFIFVYHDTISGTNHICVFGIIEVEQQRCYSLYVLKSKLCYQHSLQHGY